MINKEDLSREKLIFFLKKYSKEDLLTSFLVINLFLPNISSPIKLQYLYVIYEEIFLELNDVNQINSYKDFVSFYIELVKHIPDFYMLEDYIPEQDWGEVKYYFNKKSYKIFYGADLSNAYDFYSSLETIHYGNDDIYIENFGRSFNEEFEFTLSIQNYFINNIPKSKIGKNISPGDINTPTKKFWESVVFFLNNYDITKDFDNKLLNLYTFDNKTKITTLSDFNNNAFIGNNCNYFFIKSDNKYFPVLPRKFCTIIYETWAEKLKYLYEHKIISLKDIDFNVTKNLSEYISKRIQENDVFTYITPLDENNKPTDFLFPALLKSNERIILIYNLSLFISKDDINKTFKSLNIIRGNLVKNGFRFLLNVEKKAIEFKNEKGSLELIILIPSISTSRVEPIPIPTDFYGEVFTMDNFLAIIDEVKGPNELNDFLNFIKEFNKGKMGPYVSQLDKFGAFIESDGVLIQGAFEPDMLMLDPHRGTEFRYRKLSSFWSSFPQHNLFLHPRSWSIEKYNEKGVVLLSKQFRGFFFSKDIGLNTFFINSVINSDTKHIEGKVSEQMMNILFDELEIYKKQIEYLFDYKKELKFQITFGSNIFLKRNDEEFKYWKHLLINDESLWKIDDVYNLKDNVLGLRIVFNDDKIIQTLSTTNNRTLEIALLYDIIKIFTDYFGIKEISKEFSDLLEADKNKKLRHGMFAVEREASFPEFETTIIPTLKEYKSTNKIISLLLKEQGIKTGKYNNKDSKEIIDNVRKIILKEIDSNINKYSFNLSIPYIISKNDSLHNEYFKNKSRIKGALTHETDYESDKKLYTYYKDYLRDIKNYRFLIEKMIQLKPNNKNKIDDKNLRNLIALIDSFLNIQMLSDIVNYGINEAGIFIDKEYILDVIYSDDLMLKEKEYGEYIERINLGMEGNSSDVPEINGEIEEFLGDLDKAFKLDFNFGIRNLINVLKVLALWGNYKKIKDKPYYTATKNEIVLVCMEYIDKISEDDIKNILNFILLNTSDILNTRLEDGTILNHDELPIWEHNKRVFRYTLQPLFKVKGKYLWGPYSVDKTSLLWQGIISSYKLPANFDAINIVEVLEQKHEEIEKNLENKIFDILSKYTKNNRLNFSPFKFDSSLKNDIGDFDILSYLEKENIILNIESKIIDDAFCLKDTNRVKEKIFGRIKESNGKFQKGYLQKHEVRDEYLKENYEKVFDNLKWDKPKTKPKIISLFVTKRSSWWTANPIINTEVEFIEVRLLNDFLEKIIK